MKSNEYFIGSYGADRLIPHIYKENNTGVTPNTCTVCVIDSECADYIRNHLKFFYGSMMNEFQMKDQHLIDGYNEKYKKPTRSILEIEDSEQNLSFGNFGLFKNNEPLKGMPYTLISPYSSLGISVESFVKSLDRYLFSHGLLPDLINHDNIRSIEEQMNSAIFNRNKTGNGVYACTPVDLVVTQGKLLGFDNGDNGTVNCVISSRRSKLEFVIRLSSLGVTDLNVMKPFFREFQRTFKNYLPTIEEYSGKYVKPAKKAFDDIRKKEMINRRKSLKKLMR